MEAPLPALTIPPQEQFEAHGGERHCHHEASCERPQCGDPETDTDTKTCERQRNDVPQPGPLDAKRFELSLVDCHNQRVNPWQAGNRSLRLRAPP
jgi:hypothetical protein